MRFVRYVALIALTVAGPALAEPPQTSPSGKPAAEPPKVVIINEGKGATPPAPAPDSSAPAQANPAPAQSTTTAPASSTTEKSVTPPAAGTEQSTSGATAAAPQGSTAAPADGTANPEAAAAPPPPPPEPTLLVNIDLGLQRMTVTDNGTLKYTWPISSARYGYSTPTGTFRPSWMSKMWYSRQYDYAPMPNAIFFHRGTAIHGTYYTNQLGSPASHGCVRLAPGNAATLYKLVSKHGKELTKIVVHGKPKPPSIAERRRYDSYAWQSDDDYPPDYRARRRYYAWDGPYFAPPPPRAYYRKPPRYIERGAPRRYYSYGF